MKNRFLKFCAFAVLVAVLFTVAVFAVVSGDANSDGALNNRDAARILQHIAGWDVEIDEIAAEVTGDDVVNNRDAARILQYIAGWDVELVEPDYNAALKKNIVIPTTLCGQKTPRFVYNTEKGKDDCYIYAFIDGAQKYILVETENVYPKILDNDGFLTCEYEDSLCTYEYVNGTYKITSLANAQDEEGCYVGINSDLTILATTESDARCILKEQGVALEKIIGSRYSLTDYWYGGYLPFDLDLKTDSKIIVRTHEFDIYDGEDVFEYLVLSGKDIPGSMENTFNHVEIIVSNNPDSIRRENLVVMYAEIEADDFEFVVEKDESDYRIISSYEKVQSDDDWRYEYTVFNPWTGKKELVPGKKTSTRASALITHACVGDLIMVENGFVDDKSYQPENNVYDARDSLVWISEYDEHSGYMVVVPEGNICPMEFNCKDCLKEALEGYYGGFSGIDSYGYMENVFYTNYVKVTDDTVVCVVRNNDFGSLFNYGSIELADISVLSDPANKYLCYNSEAPNGSGGFTTKYADFLKAYILAEDEDRTVGEDLVAKFIMLVATNDEPSAMDVDCFMHEEESQEPENQEPVGMIFEKNLVIPTTLEGCNPVKVQFDPAKGDDVYYVYAWIDGEAKYISVNTKNVYPKIVDNYGNLTAAYEDRLCTYEYKNGLYTLIPLASAQDEDGNYVGINQEIYKLATKNKNVQYIGCVDDLYLTQIIGSRFDFGLDFDIVFDDDAKVIVRTHEWKYDGEDIYKYFELSVEDFMVGCMLNAFDYAEFIASNNPDSIRRENLVVMYAEIEADDFEFVVEKDESDYRIISSYEKVQSDDDWCYEYTVFNPWTGKKEVIPGTMTSTRASALPTSPYASGDLIMVENGFVDDKCYQPENNVYDACDSLVWISEYDEEYGYISVVPVSQMCPMYLNCKQCLKDEIECYCGGFCGIDYSYSYYGVFDTNYVNVTDDTVVCVIKNDNFGSLFNYGTIELADISVLSNPANKYLCYNSETWDFSEGKLTTKYADFLKAYILVEDEDHTIGEDLVAKFIMLVVTDEEESAMDFDCEIHSDEYCDICDTFGHTNQAKHCPICNSPYHKEENCPE